MRNLKDNYIAITLPESLIINDTLSVRLLNMGDANNLYNLANNLAVKKYIPWAKDINSKEDAANLLKDFSDQRVKNFSYRYGIFKGDDFVGYFGLWRDIKPNSIQTGSAILYDYRGNGVVNMFREVIEKLLYAKGIMKLVAYVGEDNLSSQKMLTRAGYLATDDFNPQGERRYEKTLDV